MFITNNDYTTIEKAIDLLNKMNNVISRIEEELILEDDNKFADSLYGIIQEVTDEDDVIVSAVSVMNGLKEKKAKDNKRISSYIADKRKENKNYARGIK